MTVTHAAAHGGAALVLDMLRRRGLLALHAQDNMVCVCVVYQPRVHRWAGLTPTTVCCCDVLLRQGHTPLMLACRGNHEVCVTLLLHCGSDAGQFCIMSAMTERAQLTRVVFLTAKANRLGETALHIAASRGFASVSRHLVCKTDTGGRESLACTRRCVANDTGCAPCRCVVWQVSYGGRQLCFARNGEGSTPAEVRAALLPTTSPPHACRCHACVSLALAHLYNLALLCRTVGASSHPRSEQCSRAAHHETTEMVLKVKGPCTDR